MRRKREQWFNIYTKPNLNINIAVVVSLGKSIGRMEESEVAVPMSVERMIEKICFNQCLPPPDSDTRKVLGSMGQDKSMHILKIISQAGRIRNLNGYIIHLSKHSTCSHSPTSTYLSPPNCSLSSHSGHEFVFLNLPIFFVVFFSCSHEWFHLPISPTLTLFKCWNDTFPHCSRRFILFQCAEDRESGRNTFISVPVF